MAQALIFSALLLATEFSGRLGILWILVGLISVLSWFVTKSPKSAVFLGVCGLGMTAWIAKDIPTLCASIALLYLNRCTSSDPAARKLKISSDLVLWLTCAAFGFLWELPLVFVIAAAGIATTTPPLCLKVSFQVSRAASLATVFCLVWTTYNAVQCSRPGKVAYIEHGKWAVADVGWTLDQINMRSAYAYSEFVKLIDGERIPLPQLNKSFREAWMITPTTPLSEEELGNIEDWVSHGGHLILVTDHTDVFGHGRVANQLLGRVHIAADYTAFFPASDHDKAHDGWFGAYFLRTANTFGGWGILPVVTARWFNEACDYSTSNFFGRLRATGEDEHSRRTIVGIRTIGRGQLAVMGDSTMFSNFATYAPDSVRLAALLRSRSVAAPVYRMFPWLLLCVSLYFASPRKSRSAELCACAGLASLMILIGAPSPLDELAWGSDKEFVWWGGDSSLVQGPRDPASSLSTAYTIASLSGRKPRWTDFPNGKTGIWVSSNPPPNGNWRWLSPDSETSPSEPEPDHPELLKLYDALGAPPLNLWNPTRADQKLNAGGIWTNDLLGDEWFDRGISPARLNRFVGLLSWIQKLDVPPRNISLSLLGKELDWKLKLPEQDPVSISLPIILEEDGRFAYLGRGISGQWTTVAGKKTLLGLKPFAERWDAPAMWALQAP